MSSENEFLEKYDRRDFDSPLATVDGVLFTVDGDELQVLLVQRAEYPARGKWALPGGFIDMTEDQSLEDTVLRKILEKTGVRPPYIEQLETIGGARRDPRGWSVTVVYFALIAKQACEARVSAVEGVKWASIDELESAELAFDHLQLIERALSRLRQKALYSVAPVFALPESFTLGEAQRLHESILGRPLEKKSFRRRIEQAKIFSETGEARRDGGRPAKLYRANPEALHHTFLRNLEA